MHTAATSVPEPQASSRDMQAEALSDDDDLVLSRSTLAALQACCLQVILHVWRCSNRGRGSLLSAGHLLPQHLDSFQSSCSFTTAMTGCRDLQEFKAEQQRAADAAAAPGGINEDWRLSQVRLFDNWGYLSGNILC